ncbi:hybrid sensor histidine kinase/response regulator [Acidobacteria bacterium AB60]|nr:hybrid sensor histidine kinase/response regulator [Acidobacteria bacterium AB60]
MRTVIFTPTGKDGRLIAALLERAGKPCHSADTFLQLCASIEEGAGAAIIAEEAFAHESIAPLLEVLQHQPPWSDFPVLLLTVSGRVTAESERLRKQREPLGNIFLLERPLRPETLLSTLEFALRGRQRQYQIRDQIRQYALAQEALLRSEKLAVTGRLAASIAHEINNPLEAITNLLYLMRCDPSPEQMNVLLSEAEQELARVTEITKQTLRFYREPSQPTETDVVSVLDSVLKLYANRMAAAGVTVERELRTRDAFVLSTPGELRQVLANLIGNAIDAMRGGGRLRVRLSELSSCSFASSIRISIADNGSGIPPEVLPSIFEPFVTTKGETGTGLGLWVTSEIMHKNGWTIRVRSRRAPGRSGTVFSIFIPKFDAPSTPTAHAASAGARD